MRRGVSAKIWCDELYVEVVGSLFWGRYLRVVKWDSLVLNIWRWFSVYCLHSCPQFWRVWLVVQRLHKLSLCLSLMFICCSGDLVIHLLEDGRGGISRYEVISCSHLFQYFRWDWLCIKMGSSRGYMVWWWFQKDGTQDLFSHLAVGWKPSFAPLVLLTISFPVGLLQVEADTMGYRIDNEVHLQHNEDWEVVRA